MRNCWSIRPCRVLSLWQRTLLMALAALLATPCLWLVTVQAAALAASGDSAARDDVTTNGQPAVIQDKPPSSGETASTVRVGESGDLQHLSFIGTKTFSAAALRQGLESTADLLEVAHPLAPQAEYLQALEHKLRSGYQHLGFPEVRVRALPESKGGFIRVNVEEGPRYVCGPVKVLGVTKDLAKAILKRLTVPSPSTSAGQRAFVFVDSAPAEQSEDESQPKQPGQVDALWIQGQPAPLSDYDRDWLKWQVTDELCNWGFFFPDLELVIEPDAATRIAALKVQVRAKGPRRYVDRIEIDGNRKNTREALLRYLDLQPGIELTRKRLAAVADRLWHAARFLDFKVTVGAPDAVKRVPLRIKLVEYDEAPPVDQEFSPIEQAMLRSRRWLAKLEQRQEDIVLELVGYPAASTGLELILSPRGEIAVLEKPNLPHSPRPGPGGFILKPGSLELYAPAQARKLVVPCRGVQFKTFINATSSAPPNDGNPFNLTVGSSFNHEPEPPKVLSCLELRLSPVVFVPLAKSRDSTCWFEHGQMIYSNAGGIMKAETRTGRILEVSLGPKPDKEKVGFQLRFQHGNYRRQARLLERNGAHLANAYHTNAPLSSSLAFVAEEILCSNLLPPLFGTNVPAATWEHLPRLVRALKLSDRFAPLDQLLESNTALPKGQESFVVPEVEQKPNGPMAWLAGWLLVFADKMLPAQSWPWMLTREAALAAQGKTKYTAQALEHIYNSADTGPLGYWAAAALLAWAHEPAPAATFSARGLERLSAADFRRDCRVLCDDKSILGQCLGNFVTVGRDLQEEDCRGLAESLPPWFPAFLKESARGTLELKGQAGLEALAPALDALWDTGFKQEVTAGLGRLKDATVAKPGE